MNKIDLDKVAFLDVSATHRQYLMTTNGTTHYPHLKRIALTYANKMYDFMSWQDEKNEDGMSEDIDYIDISYEGKDIGLPTSINRNLVKYLQKPELWTKLDCHHFIKNIAQEISRVFSTQEYNKQKDYKPGSPSYIKDKRGGVTHSQLYLGEDLFLCKSGFTGPVVISTSEEQEKLRDGAKTYIIPL